MPQFWHDANEEGSNGFKIVVSSSARVGDCELQCVVHNRLVPKRSELLRRKTCTDPGEQGAPSSFSEPSVTKSPEQTETHALERAPAFGARARATTVEGESANGA